MPSTALALPPPLYGGDHLDAREFLDRCEAIPNLKHAELIQGVVFLGSPLSLNHRTIHYQVNGWLRVYSAKKDLYF